LPKEPLAKVSLELKFCKIKPHRDTYAKVSLTRNTTALGEPMKLGEAVSWLTGTLQQHLFPRLEECWERGGLPAREPGGGAVDEDDQQARHLLL
jgi:hypothetical protein